MPNIRSFHVAGGFCMEMFLTGATGHVGAELLVTLARDAKIERIHCLVRPRAGFGIEERLQAVFELHGDVRDPARVLAVHGDLLDPGLSDRLAADARLAKVELVIHTAADTSFFRIHAQRIHAINVVGLQRLLAWAKQLRSLRTFVYVGTAMVCGVHGVQAPCTRVFESELPDPRATHLVEYTRSKVEAELLVARELDPAKALVVRPSILVCDSLGRVPRARDILWAMAAFNQLRLLPLDADRAIDMISSDFCARAIAALASLDPRERRYRVYHLTADTSRATSVRQLAAALALAPEFARWPGFQLTAAPSFSELRGWVRQRRGAAAPPAALAPYLAHWRRTLGEPRKILTLLKAIEPYARFVELGYTFAAERLHEATGLALPEPAHDFIARSTPHLAAIDLLRGALDPWALDLPSVASSAG